MGGGMLFGSGYLLPNGLLLQKLTLLLETWSRNAWSAAY